MKKYIYIVKKRFALYSDDINVETGKDSDNEEELIAKSSDNIDSVSGSEFKKGANYVDYESDEHGFGLSETTAKLLKGGFIKLEEVKDI